MLRARYLCSRNEQRKQSTLSIWPPSPRSPLRERESKRDKHSSSKHKSSREKDSRHKSSSRKHHRTSSGRKRRHHTSEGESTDSEEEEEERRRRRRKEKERRHRHRHRESTEDEEGRPERKERRRSARSASEPRKDERRTGSVSHSGDEANGKGLARVALDEDARAADEGDRPMQPRIGPSLPQSNATSDQDALAQASAAKALGKEYGRALLPGEGTAMAAYAAEGKRIPRRGEIGLESEQIEKFEKAGFVMSGSRHKRMNAVRMRKENQVISAEEKRGILKLQAEENAKKEQAIREQVCLCETVCSRNASRRFALTFHVPLLRAVQRHAGLDGG